MKHCLRLCTCLAALSAALHAQSLQHDKRGLSSLFGAPSAAKPSTPLPTGPPRDPSAPANATCKALPLTRDTWKTLNLDQYLQTYPGGDHLTVAQYAASKGAPNFDCGVGNKCDANQLCFPVPAPDWYVLFAIQQWNVQVNNIVRALSYGVNFVQATISIILSALFPATDPRQIQMFKLNFGVNAAFMMVSNTIFLDILTFFNSPQFGWNLFFNVLNNVINAASYGAAAFLPVPKEEKHEAFSEKTHEVLFQKMIDGISEEAQKFLNSPISSPNGIMTVLKNGTYSAPAEQKFLPLIETALKNVTTALFLTRILRSMVRCFRHDRECKVSATTKGPTARWKVMINFPTATLPERESWLGEGHKHKEDTSFPNAFTIENRLGFSTQFLTNASLSCQQKYGGYEPFPWHIRLLNFSSLSLAIGISSTIPSDPTADCVVNLPVCDFRNRDDLHHTLKERGVVAACRQAGLPI
ncbi:hypothetical protein VP01_316g6 [Puccinia sorghi]|uniref:DUF7872 domain-containing protein n=1 Tax=Puccinia sorghi TaxID=27349 RepID=A0A0L6UYN1_9BASI|nr:hypothetical protein VP01_316g6 [Puccinia sorghi]